MTEEDPNPGAADGTKEDPAPNGGGGDQDAQSGGDDAGGDQHQNPGTGEASADTSTQASTGGLSEGAGDPPPEFVDAETAQPGRREAHDTDIEAIATLCNDANAAYCLSIGDPTYGVWADTPEPIRSSARDGVMKHLANPGLTPEESHASWLEFKAAQGYTYGPERDDEKKLHPCMVPYADLPQAQRSKDFIFRGVVHSAARLMGLL